MQQIYEFIANKQAISRVFMLFLCCLLLSAPTFAQSSNVRITIHKKNISVIEALKEVEKQTKLSVGYNESQLKNKPSINLALEKATLESSLKEILRNTGYTYQLKGKYESSFHRKNKKRKQLLSNVSPAVCWMITESR